MADRLERLLNLTATLLDTRRPLTLDDLAERVEPRYPADKASRRRQFERDKETLRELGVPISVEEIDPFGGETGYRIRAEEYYLPALDLSLEERAALHVAVTAVRLEGGQGRDALLKLGGLEGEAAPALAELEVTPALAVLFEAVRRRAVVAFGYRESQRRLEPYGVVLRFGHWYVVGRDLERDASRAFRVDRIIGEPEVGPPDAFAPPEHLDPASLVRADPLAFGDDEPIVARVLVDTTRAGWVVDQLGEPAVVARHDDGAVEVELSVVNRPAFRDWVLDLLDHAEVVAPPELRAEMIDWLQHLAATSP